MQGTILHIGSVEVGLNGGGNADYLREALKNVEEVGPDAIVQTGPLLSSENISKDISGDLLNALEPLKDGTRLYTLTDPSTIKKHLNGDKILSELDIKQLDTSPTYLGDDEIALYGITPKNGEDIFSVISNLKDSEEGCYNILCFNSRLSPVAPASEVNGNRVLLDCSMRLNRVDALFCDGTAETVSGKIKDIEVFYPGQAAPSSESKRAQEPDYGINVYRIKPGRSDIQLTRKEIKLSVESEAKKRLRTSPEEFRKMVDEDPDAYVEDFEDILKHSIDENELISAAASEAVAIVSKNCAQEVSKYVEEVINLLNDADGKAKENLVRAVGHLSRGSPERVRSRSDELVSTLYSDSQGLAAWSAWSLAKLADTKRDLTETVLYEHTSRLRELLRSEEPIAVRYSAYALGSVGDSKEDVKSLEKALEMYADDNYVTQTVKKAIDRTKRRSNTGTGENGVDGVLERIKESRKYNGQIVEERDEKGSGGEYKSIEMLDEVKEVLASKGIDRLYAHQAEAIQALRGGENVVVATETASGKSLVYTVPALERAIRDNLRTLYIGPQNALVNDQKDTLSDIFDDVSSSVLPRSSFGVGKYTGSMDKQTKIAVRDKKPSVLLTNPDMIHYSVLPHSSRLWEWLLGSLDLIVIDEVHEYRGVFGSHVSLVLRRLRRLAQKYGSDPQFVCCSATIRNPVEHAASVTGKEEGSFSLFDRDYSESGKKKWVLWNPPRTGGEDNKRKSNHTESIQLFSDLVSEDYQTITFTRTRQGAEEYAMRSERELRGREEYEKANRVEAYEGALTKHRRDEIERGLRTDEIKGVWSTSALELGINIGSLDSVILDGYPGTLMEAHQRAGRAGRGKDESLVAFVASDNPLDQYIISNPGEFFSKEPEKAVVNPENESIMRDHLRAAANEDPLTHDDEDFFGDKTKEMLHKTSKISKRNGEWVYTGKKPPQYDMDIRSINDVTVEVKTTGGRTIANLDYESALRDVHPGAYYFHQGEKYKVEELDLDNYVATVSTTQENYITRVVRRKDIYVNEVLEERTLSRSDNLNVCLADVGVSTKFPEYAIVDRTTEAVVERVDLDLPGSSIRTKGIYFTVPPEFLPEIEKADDEDDIISGLHAAEHALISMFPLEVICDRRDIDGLSTDIHPHTQEPTIFIHGAHEGGVGICSSAYEEFESLVSKAHNVVESCSCLGGCPSCVYSPHCGNLNDDISKPKAARLLSKMSESILREAGEIGGDS